MSCPACMSEKWVETTCEVSGNKFAKEDPNSIYIATFMICEDCNYGGHLVKKEKK